MDEKKEALDNLFKFIKSDAKLFILNGKAGTGKTTLITKLFSDEYFYNKKIVLSAPTNKAVSVLQNMLKEKFSYIDFKTIHKLCKIKREINHDGDIVFNFNDNPEDKKKSIYTYDYIVVDEASMISVEIFIILTSLSKKIKGKIIFVGDISQLPPIGEPFSKVFDPGFNSDIKKITLNKIERYKNNILNFSDRIIGSINSNTTISLRNLRDDSLLIYKTQIEWLDSYIKTICLDNIVLAFTNERCRNINNYVRNKYFTKYKGEFIKGEIIVFNNFYKPLYDSLKHENIKDTAKFYTSEKAIISSVDKISYKVSALNSQYFIDINQKTVKDIKLSKLSKNSNSEIILCPICMDDVVEEILETTCNHKFCEKCIKMWLMEHQCCPFCRMKIVDEKLEFDNNPELSSKINEIISFTNRMEYNVWKIRLEGYNDYYLYVITKQHKDNFNNSIECLKQKITELKNYIIHKKKTIKKDYVFLIKRLWEYFYYNIKDVFADIGYGYCITVHKSQGSTYNNVYVDTVNILDSPKKFKQHLKCLYTAATRTSNQLHILI